MIEQQFSEAFMQCVEHLSGKRINDIHQAYRLWNQISEREKVGVWDEIGRLCKMNNKQSHDYFHNKWTKQFCDDFSELKDEFRKIIRQQIQDEKKQQVQKIIQVIQHNYPTKNFHYQTLYQFIQYQLKIIDKANQSYIEDTEENQVKLFSLKHQESLTKQATDQPEEVVKRQAKLSSDDLVELQRLLQRWDNTQ
ncbi:Conserved_hypothetical protein [Hexamita inflata]|uniref:Uncharacterized protein n=1 Tax=Hexamita inflata TaxID=28002 RepID=A0AA86QUU0_9EUKA|nr:Conserved hypothetical protein [Hexamita inflata]CAI9961157.1 Conserved hypothetical protein [Hexamita inflata]